MLKELLAGLVAGLGTRVTRAKETRLSVFKKLNRERAYQALKWKPSEGEDAIGTAISEKGMVVLEKPHEIGAWISFIETYTEYARTDNTQGEPENALDNIRKLTSLGLACLEQHGCPDRSEDDFDILKRAAEPPLAEPVNEASGFMFPHHPGAGDIPPMTAAGLDRMVPKCNVENCPIHREGGVLDQMKASLRSPV